MSEVLENILNERDKKALEYIEDVTKNADEIQERVLNEILSMNSDVEYLKKHGLNGCTDASTFKKMIPTVSYVDLKPYIDRIADGDNSPILCTNPITEFFISSGTSGKEPKLIPMFEQEFERRLFILNLVKPILKQMFPGLSKGEIMFFAVAKQGSKTRGGITCRTIVTSIWKSSHIKNKLNDTYNTPTELVLITDSYQSIYCQLLCGLYKNEQVICVGSVFAYALLRVIKFLENNWILLCNDIRTGIVNSKITDSFGRELVMNILKPNPELANFIESECSKGTWEGIIVRLWPNTKYIRAIVTGSMSQYIPLLDYYSNGLPFLCNTFTSSESFFGINLKPLCKPDEIYYTFLPTLAYFEFLPVVRGNRFDKDGQELVDLVDVKLGQEYEIVVTTYAGLYRYFVGDIVRVEGFKNKAPQFSFVCRKNVVLSIDYEKTDEAELHNAVKKAASLLTAFDATLVDYTSYADCSKIPGHYVLYWEINQNERKSDIPPSVYEDCCHAVEESLNVIYHYARSNDKSIDPLEMKIVESGTFDELMDQAVDRGASLNQYKTPRCVESPHIIELLNSKVTSNYFSKKCPEWDRSTMY